MSRNQKRRFSEIAERPSPQDDAIRTALPHSFEIPSDPIIFLVSDSLAQNELLIHGANGVKLQSSEKVKPRQPSPKVQCVLTRDLFK